MMALQFVLVLCIAVCVIWAKSAEGLTESTGDEGDAADVMIGYKEDNPMSAGIPIWVPKGHESRQEWLAFHGMTEGMFDDLRMLVVECKVLMLHHYNNITATEEIVSKMDTFLFGTMPTVEQANACIEMHRSRQKRKVIDFYTYPQLKWKMPIVYKFSGSQTVADILMIEAAIKHWEAETCIRFKRVDPKATVEDQHLLFTSQGGCWSYMGCVDKTDSYPQQINLQTRGCTSWMGLPTHEIGHAIGFWHEHIRLDRDNYVSINTKNIYAWNRVNFDVLEAVKINSMNIPYDLGSIMHYGPKELSIGDSVSVQTTNPLFERTIGQRIGLSFIDSKLANKVYCDDVCTTKLQCTNSGYTDPNDCTKCRCPEGLGGTLCDTVEPANGGCWPSSSADIELKWTDELCVESRDYAEPGGAYNNGDKCAWKIKAPEGCTVDVRFDGDFGTYCSSISHTCFQWIEIKYMNDLAARGPRFCCKDGTPTFDGKTTLTSESNNMVVIFDAQFPQVMNEYTETVDKSKRRGFRLCYKLTNPSCLPADQKKPAPVYSRTPTTTPTAIVNDEPCQPYPSCACTSWGAWSNWGECTHTCSGCGKQARYRKCLSPFTMVKTETKSCNVVECGAFDLEDYRQANMKLGKRLGKCCYNFKKNAPLASSTDCMTVV